MECNKDEALRARKVAEEKFMANDIVGAKKFALKAQNLFPDLEGISQMIATLDVHIAAEEVTGGEKNWYGILCVSSTADEEMVKKQYRKLAFMLHPDKNKSVGAEAAFKLVSEAWSVLSDKARRMVYDQKRNVRMPHQRASKSHSYTNGYHHYPSNAPSNLRAQKKSARNAPSAVLPPAPARPSTFWTSCNRCKMQYEYLRIYLNHNLLCPNCHEPFLAVETGNPTNGHNPSVPWPSQQQQDRNIHGRGRKASSKIRSSGYQQASFSGAGAYEKVIREREEKQRTSANGESAQRKNSTKRNSSGVTIEKSSFGQEHSFVSNMERPGKRRSISENIICESQARNSTGVDNQTFNFNTIFPADRSTGVPCAKMTHRQMGNLSKELSSLDIRNMLMRKTKDLVQKKLEEWKSAPSAKPEDKETTKQKEKQNGFGRENCKSLSNGDANHATEETKRGRFRVPVMVSGDKVFGPDEEVPRPVSIDVPDPDFHDFDKDRSERSFKSDQVWATYDNEDGMPRFYVLIQKVISMKPFKIRMSFLNSKTNSELGPLNWVGMGFTKTCGDFRVGKHEINDHINIFSHKVRWEKGSRGVIRVVPRKGDTWALYRNWSPDWNGYTPDDVIYKYDMVEIVEDYNEDHGVVVTPLVKVAGYKTVFHRHMDPKEVKTIPREEMFRFSHQVPSHLLTGTESPNAPKGCHELDPAAASLDLLQVITDAKEEEGNETSERPSS